MGNTRGNKYSCKHMLHDPSQTAYWDFSLDHLALYDLPDTITHILQLTGEPSLSYVGFSQGTVQGFAALSIHPHLDTSQINLFVALAPVIKPHGLDNKMVASLVNASPDLIYLIFGRRCMLASEPFW